MVDFFKKYKIQIILFFALAVFYFLTRIINIASLPIFTDEAIYVRWVQIAKMDSAQRFISLEDGKQPLFIWLAMPIFALFADPLVGVRMVSVIAGFFTMIGIFFLSYELFKSQKVGFVASALYVLYPFALVYDRMALYDSLVATLYVWALYLSILVVKRIQLDKALLLGFAIGAGVLNKSIGFINIYLLPLTLLLFNFYTKAQYKKILLKTILVILISVGAYMVITFFLYHNLTLKIIYKDIANNIYEIKHFGRYMPRIFTELYRILLLVAIPLSAIINLLVKTNNIKKISTWISLVFLASVIALLFYSILRLSPLYYRIEEKNTIFIYPFSEWVKHPFDYFYGNTKGIVDWLFAYISLPVFIIALGSFFLPFKKNYLKISPIFYYVFFVVGASSQIFLFNKFESILEILPVLFFSLIALTVLIGLLRKVEFSNEKLVLLLYFVIPLFALGLFGNNIYPRYVLFMSMSLLPLIAWTIVHIYSSWNKHAGYALLCFVIFIFAFKSYFIIFDFKDSPIPLSDVNQYNNDWPSGYGVKEAVTFFKKEAMNKKIYVATEGTFGLMPYAFEIYFRENKNIILEGYWPISETIPEKLLATAKQMPTYIVFYQPCTACYEKGIAPKGWNLEPIMKITKPVPKAYFTIYKIPSS